MAHYAENSYKWGVFWSFLSALLWSSTFIGSRHLLGNDRIDAVSLSLIRFLVGGIGLFIGGCVLFPKKMFKLERTDLVALIFLSSTGITGMSLFLFWGMNSTSAINSSMIVATNPIIVMILGIFVGEAVSKRKIAGLIFSIFGCFLTINILTSDGFQYDSSHFRGDFLVGMSALCWALYSVFGKKTVNKLGGYVTTAWVVLFGALELLILRFMTGSPTLPTSSGDWLIVIYIAIFPSAIAFFAYYEALRLIELSLLNVMQYLTPVFTIILALVLLGEKVNLLNILGIFLIIVGVIITSDRNKTKKSGEASRKICA